MNISLEDLLEIFVEAQGMKRQKGLRTRDYMALVNVQIRRCDHPERRQAIKKKRDRIQRQNHVIAKKRQAAGIHSGKCSCGRHKTENICKGAMKRSMQRSGATPKRPFDDGSETEWERTRRYCG